MVGPSKFLREERASRAGPVGQSLTTGGRHVNNPAVATGRLFSRCRKPDRSHARRLGSDVQPTGGPYPPTFEELFEHVRGRLSRDARYRQRLAPTPLRLNAPVWIDDDAFDAQEHILPAVVRDSQ